MFTDTPLAWTDLGGQWTLLQEKGDHRRAQRVIHGDDVDEGLHDLQPAGLLVCDLVQCQHGAGWFLLAVTHNGNTTFH